MDSFRLPVVYKLLAILFVVSMIHIPAGTAAATDSVTATATVSPTQVAQGDTVETTVQVLNPGNRKLTVDIEVVVRDSDNRVIRTILWKRRTLTSGGTSTVKGSIPISQDAASGEYAVSIRVMTTPNARLRTAGNELFRNDKAAVFSVGTVSEVTPEPTATVTIPTATPTSEPSTPVPATAEPTPAPEQAIQLSGTSEFVDDFSTVSWPNWSFRHEGIGRENGMARLPVSTGSFVYMGVWEARSLDWVSIETSSFPPSTSDNDLRLIQRDATQSNRWIDFRLYDGRLFARSQNGDGTPIVVHQSSDFDTTWRWWRFRSVSGVLSWETSADGSSWNVLHEMEPPFSLAAVTTDIHANTWKADQDSSWDIAAYNLIQEPNPAMPSEPTTPDTGSDPVDVIAVPPTGSIYWGTYTDKVPWYTDRWDQLEQSVGKKQSIVHWGQAWEWDAQGGMQPFFPTDFNKVRDSGAIPMINWNSWKLFNGEVQPDYRLSEIYSGRYDDYIRSWAEAARDWGHPFYLRHNHEMNGWWQFPWAEQINGNQPGDYVRAWRHVHDIFTDVGATNVTWVWSPNIAYPGATTPLADLYPGDAYVDWVAMDGYNFGSDHVNGWQSFAQVFGPTYRELQLLAPGKPIMLAEWGSVETGGDKAAWITDALEVQLPYQFPDIRAVVWFNWNDDRLEFSVPIDSSPEALDAFRRGIASSYYADNSFSTLAGPKVSPLP